MGIYKRLWNWCRRPTKPALMKLTRLTAPLYFSVGVPGVLICVSASLFVLGTYLSVIKVPVWVGDPYGFGEYEPMRAYMPFGLLLWLLALALFVCGIILGTRKLEQFAQLRTFFSMTSLMVGVTLGVLALTSILLPWVIAERTTTVVETRGGTFTVPQYYALTGLNLVMEIGEIFLVFAGGIISALAPLVSLFESERPDTVKAFLFVLSSVCILGPVALAYGDIQRNLVWGISFGQFGIATVFKSPGIGFFVAAFSCVGLMVSGIITAVKSTRRPMA